MPSEPPPESDPSLLHIEGNLGRSIRNQATVFVRESTGLVKNVSFLDSIAINVSYMSIGAALALIGLTMSALPTVTGVNLVLGSAIAAAFAIPQVVVYSIMQRRVSRTGGDYVWLSRTLGSFIGSTVTFAGITLETMPYIALIALSAVAAIGSVGATIRYPIAALALPIYKFLVGSAIVTALVIVNIVRPRMGFRIVSVFWIVGVLSVVLAVLSLLFAGNQGIANYISSKTNTTYTSVVNSYQGSTDLSLSATLLILPFFALFAYPWFNAAPSVGSELRGRKTISWNTPVSFLMAFLLLTVPLATMYYVGGFAFTNAGLKVQLFSFWTLAMGVSNSFLLQLIIGLGWILFTVAVLAFGIITISRYILAQAFDRFLPDRLSYVSPRYGSPVAAHLLDLVITVVLIGLAAFLYATISIVSLYGAVVASMIYFAFVGAAAMIYAVRRERAGRTRLALVIAGLLQVLVFSYLTYEFFAYPDIWGGNTLAYGYVATTFVAGVIIYLVSKKRQSRRGVDLSLTFKEIPPE